MRNYNQLISIIIVLLCFSCKENKPNKIVTNVDSVTLSETEKHHVKNTLEILKYIPLPSEAARIFELDKLDYNKEFLNPISNLKNYNTTYKQALNFGVYGADLSYVTVFDVTQESMLYMNCSKEIAENLGLTTVFDVSTIEQIENNITNKDSVLAIAKNCYIKAEQYFKATENEKLNALILVGGWVEGLFLGTRQVPEIVKDSQIIKSINQQKTALVSLISLLEAFKDDTIIELINQLKQLDEIFVVDSNEDFSKLAAKIAEIRTQIIN